MTDPNRRANDKIAWRITRWVLDAFLIVLVCASGWSFKLLVGMNANQKVIAATLEGVVEKQKLSETRTTSIELWKAETIGNRFTVTDGHELWKEIADIRENLAALPTIGTDPMLLKTIESLESRVVTLERRP